LKSFFKLYFVSLFFLIIFTVLFYIHFSPVFQNINYSTVTTLKILPSPTFIPTPFDTPKPTAKAVRPTPTPDTTPWGLAQQVDQHTWTMRIASDSIMATPSEILSALNAYRQRYGSQILTWDDKLAVYAQSRANYFYQIKNIDEHVGFNNFLEKEDGFNKLGYTYLGENISYGYQLNGVHLIEWIYAGDEPHNKNQLDTKWDHVGIGVKGTATCLIFATGKM
jgi:uncharacterized protein YkwD